MVLNDLEQKYKNNYHILPHYPTLLISFTTLTPKDSPLLAWRSALFFNELLRNSAELKTGITNYRALLEFAFKNANSRGS